MQSLSRQRVGWLGALHAPGIAAALLAAIGLRSGWRDGLDLLTAHHLTVSASRGIFWVFTGAVGNYDSAKSTAPGGILASAGAAVLGGAVLATRLLWATSSWPIAPGMQDAARRVRVS